MENEQNSNESLVNMINAVDEGNPTEFMQLYKAELYSRVGNALKAKESEIAKSYGDSSDDPLNDDVSFDEVPAEESSDNNE